jgi:predicted ATP-grasp superfamily ATP-dependent carboligase
MNNFTPHSFLNGKSVVWFSSKMTDAEFLLESKLDISVVGLVGSLEEFTRSDKGFSLETRQANPIIDSIEKLNDVIILPFSSSAFVSNLALEFEQVKIAGNPHLLEQVFNNKPWVETQIKALGITTPAWKYIMPIRPLSILEAESSWVTRLSDMSGGLGMQQTHQPLEDVAFVETKLSKDIFSVAPFIKDAISLNISACVFPSGDITLHPLSLQIIGSRVCTDRRFGYCGNDFGAGEHLSDTEIQCISAYTDQIGKWLLSYGYIGAFGVDYMLADGIVYFSELNPRFQASSHVGAELMDIMGYQNIYIDHLAAHADITPERAMKDLVDVTRRQSPKSQIFAYNTDLDGDDVSRAVESSGDGIDLEWKSASIEPHGLLFRLYKDASVMHDGKTLDKDIESEVVWHKLRIMRRINNNKS